MKQNGEKPISFGLNLTKLTKEIPLKKNIKIISELKDIIAVLIKKAKKNPKSRNLKVADKPLIVPVLERPEEFTKKTAETMLKNSTYGTNVSSQYAENYKILSELKSKGISLPDAPWDAPMTDSGILTQHAYDNVIKNIQDSNLDSYKKEDYIQKLKRINFKGNEDGIVDSSLLEHTNLTEQIDVEPDVSTISEYIDVLHEHIKDFGENIAEFLKDSFDPGHLG